MISFMYQGHSTLSVVTSVNLYSSVKGQTEPKVVALAVL